MRNFEINSENVLRNNNIKEIPWDTKYTPKKSTLNTTYHSSAFRKSIMTNDDLNTPFLSIPNESRRYQANIDKSCNNQSKAERTSCLHIPVYTSACPSHFEQLTDVYGRVLCYIIMENQIFPPRCPYLHSLPFYEIQSYLLKHFRDRSIWLRAFRNNTNGFAHFEWIEPGSDVYGKVMSERITNANHTINRNCLIFQNGNILRVSCNDRYDALCMYSMNSLQRSGVSLCLKHGYENCIVSNYDFSSPTCFCMKLDVTQPKKHSFCEKLAEPIYPYQTELLIKFFMEFKGRTCWIGLYKPSNRTKMCKWWSTDIDVSYTRWARPEACEFDEGAIIFDIPPFYGWSLARDRSLPCALCEFTVKLNDCSLELRFLPLESQIELTIHNYGSISMVNKFSLYCFSDTNEDDFKKRIPVLNYHHLSNSDTVITRLDTVVNLTGYYWCEAFQYNSENVIKSNRILVTSRKEHGYEFSLYIEVQVQSEMDPFTTRFHYEICKQLSLFIERKYKRVLVRPMRAYFDEHRHRIILLIHISTRNTLESAKKEYKILYDVLRNIPNIKIIYFKNSELCLPDITKTSDGDILEWPETIIGASAIPSNRICLDETKNMLPVIRHCEGDFLYGAKWGLPSGDCTKNTTHSEVTEELFDLTKQNVSATTVTTDLVRITQQDSNKQPIDVHLVSVLVEDLSKVTDEDIDYYDFSRVINNVMNFNKLSMEEAQRLLNSTDKILAALDDFMKKGEPIFIVYSKLIVYINILKEGSIGGLALYNKNPDKHSFKSYDVIELYQNTSFEDLLHNEALETAVLLPTNTVRYIKNTLPSNQLLMLIIMIFYDDLLFTEQKDAEVNQQSKTKIISVSVPGFKTVLDSPIQTAFKMPRNYSNTRNCSHWNYGLDQFMVSIHGKWKTDNVSEKTYNSLEVCEFFHMTHFGLLLQGIPQEIPYNETVLEILTAIGSALSLIGMTWIFGIIGAFGGGVVFTYLFCIVATLRGLVLFLFFIVGNKETRLMWNKRYVYYLARKWRSPGSTLSSNTTVVSSE
ncbi:hypothetical protein ILUMI_26877 [Ignelater luminosus]|uniref:Uncharacterized protein n=1 Tax=Ignelater luminosus TaxID=2038154 RepID=A0A8K0C912_IGNLU|nr:hypothetical protein ILUMI_26877 [Ignelater luminosus]